MKYIKIVSNLLAGVYRWIHDTLVLFWKRAWWSKAILIMAGIVVGTLIILYSLYIYYVVSTISKPTQYGVTFVADYARALDLDAEETMDALLLDLGADRFRLVSYWNKIEATEGRYDFSELDWQFRKAEAVDAKISLAIGLRQPRWPECHVPDWVDVSQPATWEPALLDYLEAVVSRYKDSPSLVSYQLENEYYLEAFGDCPEPVTERLQNEFNLVKQLDPDTPIIMSRSSNTPGIMQDEPLPDIVGVSVYRRVWDGNLTKSYFTYPLPSWYYGSFAGLQKLVTGRESTLHEMQMEPWPANGLFVRDASIEEQNKSFRVENFHDRVDFAEDTGLKTIDFWGAEWWYWRMVEKNDPSFWNAAKESFSKHDSN